MTKNICINCLDKLLKKRDENNTKMSIETEEIIISLQELIQDVGSEDFSNFKYFEIKFFNKNFLTNK